MRRKAIRPRLGQLTLRGLDAELATALRRVAKERGTSLNRAALFLLRRGAGLGEEKDRPDRIADQLDRHFGTWTADEERDFLKRVEMFETIDPSFATSGTCASSCPSSASRVSSSSR